MKRFLAFLIGVGILFPAVSYGHGLNPTHFPLGPFPLLSFMGGFWGVIVLPIMLTVEFLILWKFMPSLGLWGNLWRSLVLYILAHIFESGILYVFYGILDIGAGWNEIFLSLTVCLLVNFLSKALAGSFLYKCKNISIKRFLIVIGATTLVSYSAALGYILLISKLRDVLNCR